MDGWVDWPLACLGNSWIDRLEGWIEEQIQKWMDEWIDQITENQQINGLTNG